MKDCNLGVMLDCSRNSVMSVPALKKFICNLEKMGYNFLQLYTEDTFEVPEEPLFGHFRGRYSHAELKEIDAFAKKHNIELMPCVQALAHFNQIFYWDKFWEIKDANDILLCGDEKTYEFIDNIFKTLSECFTCKTVNIGMDEAELVGAGKYFHKNGYRPRFDILLEHLNRVSEIAKKYGFTLLMWSDMFFKIANGGSYYTTDSKPIPEEIRAKVPENVRLIYWDYYHTDKALYDNMLERHKDFGKDVWFAGGAWKWEGFQPDNQMSFNTLTPAIKSCEEKGVKNIIVTMWGDNGNECPANSVLPSLVYASECVKGNFDIENTKVKFEELFGESFDDFMLLDLALPKKYKRYRNRGRGVKELFYSDCFMGKFDATVTGNESKYFASKVKKLRKAKENSKNFAYIFESYEKLCKVLSVKYNLGVKTRTFYQNGDKEALKLLVKDYSKTIKYVEDFLISFRKMWMTDSKPHGFDVQDIRIGGLLQRLKSCKERLVNYLDGKINVIEELEESLYPVFPVKEEKILPHHNLYTGIASLNLI